MAMAGIGVERYIANDPDIADACLDGANGPANKVIWIQGLAPLLVAKRRLGIWKQRDRRQLQLHRGLGRLDCEIDRKPLDARHARDLRALVLSLDEKDRPDEIVRRQCRLAHQPPRPVGAAVSAEEGGGEDGWLESLALAWSASCHARA